MKKGKSACCPTAGAGSGSCRVESLITVDERGQMVLPKDIRDRAGIQGGDKLALVSWEKEGGICCLTLMKVDAFSGMVREILGPLMGDVLPKG